MTLFAIPHCSFEPCDAFRFLAMVSLLYLTYASRINLTSVCSATQCQAHEWEGNGGKVGRN